MTAARRANYMRKNSQLNKFQQFISIFMPCTKIKANETNELSKKRPENRFLDFHAIR